MENLGEELRGIFILDIFVGEVSIYSFANVSQPITKLTIPCETEFGFNASYKKFHLSLSFTVVENASLLLNLIPGPN